MTLFKPALAFCCALGLAACDETTTANPSAPAGSAQNCARVLGVAFSNGQKLAMIDTGRQAFFTPFDSLADNPSVCPFNEEELDQIQF